MSDIAAAIVETIADHPGITGREVCARLDIVTDRFHRYARSLVRRGVIVRAGYGRYRVATVSKPDPVRVPVREIVAESSFIAPLSRDRLMAGR